MVNYLELNELHGNFSAQGLTILGFPCNQFGNQAGGVRQTCRRSLPRTLLMASSAQEPGDNDEILNGLKYVRPGNGYVPKFTVLGLTTVNGDGTVPLFTFLKAACPTPNKELSSTAFIGWSPVMIADIAWNFEKFLVDSKGRVRYRFDTPTDPSLIVPAIEQLLHEKARGV